MSPRSRLIGRSSRAALPSGDTRSSASCGRPVASGLSAKSSRAPSVDRGNPPTAGLNYRNGLAIVRFVAPSKGIELVGIAASDARET